MDLDGSNQVKLSAANSGFHYGLSLSADEKRLTLHVTGDTPAFYNPGVYSINVVDLATKERVYDGARELWVMDPDGSNQRRMTQGYQKKGADFAHWFHVGSTQE